MSEQETLFPKAHKEVVLSMLENYEKDTNDRMQKTIDAITKKKDELEIIGKELQMIRQAKKYVEAEMIVDEAFEAPTDSEHVDGGDGEEGPLESDDPGADYPGSGAEQPES